MRTKDKVILAVFVLFTLVVMWQCNNVPLVVR